MVSTTLALVMITTLLFGTFMKVTQIALTGSDDMPEIRETFVSGRKSGVTHISYKTRYDELVHPNFEGLDSTPSKKEEDPEED